MSSKNYRELQVGDNVNIDVGSQRCIGIVEEILKVCHTTKYLRLLIVNTDEEVTNEQ